MAQSSDSLISESDLVSRTKAGDKHAFELLYIQCVDHVYALCVRGVANISLAEELTQVAFIRAWETIQSFRNESTFSTWLHRITINVVLAHHRSEQRRIGKVEAGGENAFEYVSSTSFNPESIDLEKAIASLPTKARLVLILHDIEGYQHDDIAAMLEVTIGTSKSQLHRAHNLLKEWLQE